MPVGKLTRWNRDRGFGFIIPEDGSEDVFCHASELSRDCDEKEIRDGDLMEYDLEFDRRKNKDRAVNVTCRDPSGRGRSDSRGRGGRDRSRSRGRGGRDRSRSRGRGGRDRYSRSRSRGRGGKAGGKGVQFREGDWDCAKCGFHNFARNTECKKCGAYPADRDDDRGRGRDRSHSRGRDRSRSPRDDRSPRRD